MDSRVIALIARGDKSRWPLAGDQLFIDLHLGQDHLPPGTQLAIGSAVIEITAPPHTGCKKFLARFGQDALQFVNSPLGKELRLRGLNARIVRSGVIHSGDRARKLPR
jgi:MOSC domain-containing protein YiiM